MRTSEAMTKLVAALKKANAPAKMVQRAQNGDYDDYLSDIANPIQALVNDARRAKLNDIAKRAITGEFDGTKADADAWAQSPDGQETFRGFGLK
jgi:predicted MPP superfamily phosphohydrolase